MKINLTTDQGEVLDIIDVDNEIGDLTKPLPQAELLERILSAVKQEGLKEMARASYGPTPLG
jgi:hypothetical protein